MRIHVIIPTLGRPETVIKLVRHLGNQTRPADEIIVVATCPEDVAGVADQPTNPTVLMSRVGSCCQRNTGIDSIRGKSDVIIFFDDDFVPADDFIETVENVMTANPDVVGLSGELVDDGILHDPIPFETAVSRLKTERPEQTGHRKRTSLYGCNMVIRLEAMGELRFDENLPLYGWFEDVDLTYQLGQRGRLIGASEATGIHLGVRGGRQSGIRLGYSQVANIIYMYRKGTIEPNQGWLQMVKNFTANLAKSIVPEPHIDRRGRLAGNMIAFADLVRGRLDPGRILSM